LQRAVLPPIGFGLCAEFAVRISALINTPSKLGFAYETLAGHLERGVSEFYFEEHAGKLFFITLPWLISFSLDRNPDPFEIDPHVLAATITNCAFRNGHHWNAVLTLWALGKWMVIPRLFCMGNGYFRRRSPGESHCLRSNCFFSAKAQKGFNMDRCRLNGDAPRSCAFVEDGLTNRWRNRWPLT
jgi:Domain of unknown function (DUF1990)